MGQKPKESTVIERLSKKVQDAKTILSAISMMNLDEQYPEKLKTAIAQFLNEGK
jgi:hypothetical protein